MNEQAFASPHCHSRRGAGRCARSHRASPATAADAGRAAATTAGQLAGRRRRQDDVRDLRAEGERGDPEQRRDRPARARPEQAVRQGRQRRVDAGRVAAAAWDLRVRDRRRRRVDARPVEPERGGQRPRRARHRGGAGASRLAAGRRMAGDRARHADPALVRLEGDADAPPGARLHAARLRRGDQEAARALPAARRRRQRCALVAAGPGQRDRRQPAGRRPHDADGDRDDRRPSVSTGAGRAGRAGEGRARCSRTTC